MPPTQSKQLDILIAFMESNPGIAKNYLPNTQAKAKSKILWSNLVGKLNSSGPPEKNVEGWKNVWKDYKYNLKRKMRENALHSSGTGAGPNKQKPYSDNEKAVIAILDLNEAVSGNLLGKHFGGPSGQRNEPEMPLDNENETIDAVDRLIDEVIMEDEDLEVNGLQTKTDRNVENVAPLPKKKKKTRGAMLEQHVKMQGDVLVMLKEKLTSLETTQNAILKEIKQTNRWHKEADRWRRKSYELKKEKFEEEKMNNIRKNKSRLELLSLKSRKVKLQEFQLRNTLPSDASQESSGSSTPD